MNWWQELSPEPDNNTRPSPRKRTRKKPHAGNKIFFQLKINKINIIYFSFTPVFDEKSHESLNHADLSRLSQPSPLFYRLLLQ
ncbi:hypothetical protein [Dickeya fangzhongdai]|uniref:hypothetical protein n=1 Tax=Dickeya fangzhongdai TaxID=1778540 RepID=UPI001E4FEE96|nr:hypothetical protein [Dickeya fangzhongdai]